MIKDSTRSATRFSATIGSIPWKGVRTRIRGFIGELFEAKLAAALGRARYECPGVPAAGLPKGQLARVMAWCCPAVWPGKSIVSRVWRKTKGGWDAWNRVRSRGSRSSEYPRRHGRARAPRQEGDINLAAGCLDFIGAGCRSRTRDLLITNQLLYQLS